MSATSARRPKDRNAVVSSSVKPQKPFSRSVTPNPLSLGKENSSSSTSSDRTRPATRPKTRPDGSHRWSTSSAPRGRSPSPSELRSASRASKSGSSVPRVRVSDFAKERKGLGVKSTDSGSDFGGARSRVRVSDKISKARESLDSLPVKEVKVEAKYQSKLHEKLAFLEGKVKRIASDIKRTKEILDQNNPDASKVILLDIQDKITGIEKAMGKVGGSDLKLTSLGNGIGAMNSGKSSVKGLNSEELEARLLPHNKLLKNRAINSNADDVKASVLIDFNPIEVEFLASLSEDQLKDKKANERAKVEEADSGEVEKENEESRPDVTIVRDDGVELVLTTDETLDESDEQENKQGMSLDEEFEDNSIDQLNEIGLKTTTGGWFVGEGESALLAHDDGSCSFHDVVNTEEKAIYKPPSGASPNMWRDCWLIRAPSADGCAGRYVVAASAANAMDSGFCSWDFYTKDVRAFHVENATPPPPPPSRTVLGPLPTVLPDPETRQWWYRPSGALIAATATCQRAVSVYDIRDGEKIMRWDVSRPVASMEFSSPLQWRNRGKVVVAETESISLWDVNSLSPQALISVPFGRKIAALHVNNTDAELGGGVRQRLSSSEAEGNDGVFCTQDSINILDFRHPNGVGIKISRQGLITHSVFSRGDSVILGCSANSNSSSSASALKRRQTSSEIQQFSLRKQRLFATYAIPESNADPSHAALTQVWGNSSHVMGISGLGLFVFDASRDIEAQLFASDLGKTIEVKETVGPEDMYLPSFDFSGTRALLISRDRPAMWKHLA